MSLQGIVEAFGDILTSGAPVFRTILLHLASLPPVSSDSSPASLVHCSTGNNRTGVLIGVLLSLLKVSRANIVAEYVLSDVALSPSRPAVVARLAKNPVFARPGGGGVARAERMVAARPESMYAMLDLLEERWGGAEADVREVVGLSADEVAQLKEVMVV
jgi:protein tyrosine/serine phosphatase